MEKYGFDLTALERKCFGNEVLVQRLVDVYLSSLSRTIDGLVQAVSEGDFEEVHLIAHRFKGESGTVCHQEFHDYADALCRAAQSQDYNELVLLLAGLSQSVVRCSVSDSSGSLSQRGSTA